MRQLRTIIRETFGGGDSGVPKTSFMYARNVLSPETDDREQLTKMSASDLEDISSHLLSAEEPDNGDCVGPVPPNDDADVMSLTPTVDPYSNDWDVFSRNQYTSGR